MRITARECMFYSAGFLLVFNVLAVAAERKWEEQDSLLAYLKELGIMNQETAELLRGKCLQEWLHSRRVQHDLGLEFMGGSLEANLGDKVDVLLHLVDQLISECVSGKELMLSDGRDEKCSDTWFTTWFKKDRGSVRRTLVQISVEAPALAPSPVPSFPPTHQISANTPSISYFGGNNSSNGSRSDRKSSKTNIIVAVLVTATVTFIIAAFLFTVCLKYGSFSLRRKNDERPLLSLSISDYSTASSHKLFGQGSQFNEEKIDDQPFPIKMNLNHSKVSDVPSLSRIENSVGIGNAFLDSDEKFSEMPPRIWEAPVFPFPPLKPPPGRAELRKPPSASQASSSHSISVMPFAGQLPAVQPHPYTDVVATTQVLRPSGASHPSPPLPPPPGARRPPSGPPPPPGPPPPGSNLPPPRPPPLPSAIVPPPPLLAHSTHSRHQQAETSTSTGDSEIGAAKAKLKPFFWDKVLANPGHSMVWDQIKSGSFQFNEEMIETLFGYTPAEKTKNEAKKESPSQDASPQIKIIDPKKAQNLSIMLKALNVTTEEVCDALTEGNELPPELIQTLLRMSPTSEEELKLSLYTGEPAQLGPAERFLKVLIDIPFAFKRLESLLFMCTLQEEMSMLKESFAVLEAACTELRKSRLFLKLLEAVLKTGNRMNDGTFRGRAQAFKLDTLLKLSDVKGTDGKTTLLHFVVEEIIRSESVRAAREAKEDDVVADSDETLRNIGLHAVSSISDELSDVKKAAVLDADTLTGTVVKLRNELLKTRKFLESDMKNISNNNGFHQVLRSFVQNAEVDIMQAQEEESRIMVLVKNTSAYFHGNSGKDEGLRLFVIVRDFLLVLDKVCKQVKLEQQQNKPNRPSMVPTVPEPRQTPSLDIQQRITDRRVDDSSSEDES